MSVPSAPSTTAGPLVLPEGWTVQRTPDNHIFFSHAASGKTSWAPPSGNEPSAAPQSACLTLPAGWTVHQTTEGAVYFAHTATGASSWVPPSEALDRKGSRPAAPSQPLAPWERNQKRFINKYYDKQPHIAGPKSKAELKWFQDYYYGH